MRFNLEIDCGNFKMADADKFGRLVNVSLWMGNPADAVESRYKIAYPKAWPPEIDVMKIEDAVRVAMAHALNREFDPFLVTLIVEEESPRWQGRLIGTAAQ